MEKCSFLKEIVMKQKVLLAIIVLLTATTLVQAQRELHGAFEVIYQSKYIWRGIDIYNDKSAIQSSVSLDLFGTGFGFSAMAHRANSSGAEAGERWDYTLNYKNALFGDEPYATQYMVGWVYYNFPHISSRVGDLQEVYTALSWPEILPVEGLVPTYVLVKLWPAEGNSTIGGNASGWAHIFMLDYGLSLERFLPDYPDQVLRLHSEFVYNDGVDPRGGVVDHDWSNAVLGIATDFKVTENVTVTPGIYHQVTMDKSINPDKDETWFMLSTKYEF
jgi:hypothetical protein